MMTYINTSLQEKADPVTAKTGPAVLNTKEEWKSDIRPTREEIDFPSKDNVNVKPRKDNVNASTSIRRT